jgi:hypothetical protein
MAGGTTVHKEPWLLLKISPIRSCPWTVKNGTEENGEKYHSKWIHIFSHEFSVINSVLLIGCMF